MSRQHSEPVSAVPLIVEHGFYSTEQIIAALAISPSTLDTMVKAGMRCAQRGTKRRYFLGRHVIEFLFEGEL